jgi:hypothetical protein
MAAALGAIFLSLDQGALAQEGADQPKFEAQKIGDISIGYGLAIGDVDGDGKSDVLLADKKEIVWYHNPSWKRHVIASRLSLKDNVCLAARDIDGDGKVEVAAGANWNPGETSDREQSGSVHYLVRQDDPAKEWKAVKLPHDPTVHRMHWIRNGDGKFALVMLPLHGIGNRGGQGENGVRVTAYHPPADLGDASDASKWKTEVLNDRMHITHNFDIVPGADGAADTMVIGGREGIVTLTWVDGKWKEAFEAGGEGYGEVRRAGKWTAGIRPLHGNKVTLVEAGGIPATLDESLAAGHALAIADVLGVGTPQIIAGWRDPDGSGKVGIRLYTRKDDAPWQKHSIDDNEMACEDLKVADLNGDGKLDIVAAGRRTKNLVIYWNRR